MKTARQFVHADGRDRGERWIRPLAGFDPPLAADAMDDVESRKRFVLHCTAPGMDHELADDRLKVSRPGSIPRREDTRRRPHPTDPARLARIWNRRPSVERIRPGRRPPGQSAFTLIELLVGILIISILASLWLPALSRVHRQAQGTVCLANLKQLQTAFRLYTDDENGLLPANLVRWVNGRTCSLPGSWVEGDARTDPDTVNLRRGTLYPYVRCDATYRCPADRATIEAVDPPRVRPRSRTYAMSATLSASWGFPRESGIHSPCRTYVFIDVTGETIDSGAFGLHNWTCNPVHPKTAHGWGSWGNLPADRHAGSGVLSYLDGHAARQGWRQLPKAGRPFGSAYTDPLDIADARWLIEQTPWYQQWLPANYSHR